MKLYCITNFVFILCFIEIARAQSVDFIIENCNSLVSKITTINNVDGYLLVISESPITFSPTNGTSYAYSLIYGFGPNVSNNNLPSYVMYFGNENVTLTGFSDNTNYYYAVFFYFKNVDSPVYSLFSPIKGELNFSGIPQVKTNPIDASCNNSMDGNINLIITNGVPPFDYTVNGNLYNNANSFLRALSLGPFLAGTYSVIINDANGCSNSFVANISEPPPLKIEVLSNKPVNCFGENDGAFEFTLNGTAGSGTVLQYNLPTSYTIEKDISNSNLIIPNLPSGEYQLFLTLPDNTACTDQIEFTIESPKPLQIKNFFKKEPTCKDAEDGEIAIEIIGGTQPYIYSWTNVSNNENILNGSVVLNLSAGDYLIEIFDANFCTFTAEINLPENDRSCFDRNDIPNVFSPNGDDINDIWHIKGLQEQYPMNLVTIINRWGAVVFEKESCNDNCWKGNAINSNSILPTGTYFYVIQLNSQNLTNNNNLLKGTINLLR